MHARREQCRKDRAHFVGPVGYTRSDAIVKLPSNDPYTMVALARTMIDVDRQHPITRHLNLTYWKGGEEPIEREIYKPANIEKIVAWGGFSSIRHISKYLQPGIDLVTLDPKKSTTLIGREAFESEETVRQIAERVAVDDIERVVDRFTPSTQTVGIFPDSLRLSLRAHSRRRDLP